MLLLGSEVIDQIINGTQCLLGMLTRIKYNLLIISRMLRSSHQNYLKYYGFLRWR